MFVVIFPKLFRNNFRGLAIYPFIFLKDKKLKENKEVITHENIHLRQQIEMLWIFFFLWYIIEFLIRWIRYKNANKAYFNVCFEREAYVNEHNYNYLENKKYWSFTKYL